MTHDEAARLVCGRCRSGQKAEHYAGTSYYFHGNVFVRCDASPIWDNAKEKTP